MTPASLRILLSHVVDYAGLFPPAELHMRKAMVAYSEYRRSEERWMLGRFVVHVLQLHELEDCSSLLPMDGEPWRLSAIVEATGALGYGPGVYNVVRFNSDHTRRAHGLANIEALEIPVTSLADIESIGDVSDSIAAGELTVKEVYVEVPLDPDPGALIAAAAGSGLRVKARTGGVTPKSIPSVAHVARFLARCHEHGAAFKATAGLHHPIRGTYPLTYRPGSPTAELNGFLNVWMASALLCADGTVAEAERLLSETDATAFSFDDGGFGWRDRRIDAGIIAATRQYSASSFGSCSFQEPVDDLRKLGLLDSSPAR